MLSEKKIKTMIEDELSWLEAFAQEEITNIYKNKILDADRKIVRMSALYEVLEEVPSETAQDVVKSIKDKLQRVK